MMRAFAFVFAVAIFGVITATRAGDATSAPSAAVSTNTTIGTNAPSISPRDFLLSDLRTLHMDVPAIWKDSLSTANTMGTAVDNILFLPRDHSDYAVVIAAIHVNAVAAAAFDVQSNLVAVAQSEVGNAVEPLPEVHTLKIAGMDGAWLRLTDEHVSVADHRPGEYKYLTMGYLRADSLVLSLRIVSNVPDGKDEALALAMLKSARLTGSQ
jgi:hypothetical protein